MGYYHIKNIKINKKENYISADLADSNWEPLNWHHIQDLSEEFNCFEEKYARFIYDLVSGNFHPTSNNRYSKLVMNYNLKNYYDDAKDLGLLETYSKYENNITKILNNNENECVYIASDRELNPHKYYCLEKVDLENSNYNYQYYKNEIGELYCINNNDLFKCSDYKSSYGEPLYVIGEIDEFVKYNDFFDNSKNIEEIQL